MAESSTQARFNGYLDAVNRALGAHRDEFPYKQIMEGAEKALAHQRLGIGVYARDPDHPHAWFTVQLADGTFRLVEHGKHGPDMTWKMPESHLEKVAEDPQEYVEHPEKLDLDWLKSRVMKTR